MVTTASWAGIFFPPCRARRILRRRGLKVGLVPAIFTAAAIEYLVTEVVDATAMLVGKRGRRRIKPSDIAAMIARDAELGAMFRSDLRSQLSRDVRRRRVARRSRVKVEV